MLIQGHNKVSFTPDGSMKELVNKPFSLFETVMLNEGVNFDDMSLEDIEAEVEEELKLEDETQDVSDAAPEPELEPEPEQDETPELKPV